MNHYKIEFLDPLSKDIEEKMRNGLAGYESSHGIDVNYKPISVVLTDDVGDTFGVLNAFTAFAEVYICDLWVDRAYRGNGYGRKLLQALEDRFKDKGFNNINLVTSAFQAPDFYKKCGFKAEFVRKNTHNPKLTKTFFIKYFDDDRQLQGIINKDSD